MSFSPSVLKNHIEVKADEPVIITSTLCNESCICYVSHDGKLITDHFKTTNIDELKNICSTLCNSVKNHKIASTDEKGKVYIKFRLENGFVFAKCVAETTDDEGNKKLATKVATCLFDDSSLETSANLT